MYIWLSQNKGTYHGQLSVWSSLKLVIADFLGNHRSSQYQKVGDELMENFFQIGARMSVKCTSSNLIWTVFQRIVETSVKNRVSAFTKISVIWRNTIKVDGMWSFLPTTAGAWRGMWSLLNTKRSPWRDYSSMSSFLCSFYSSCYLFKIFCKSS